MGNNFWLGIAAAQATADRNDPTGRRHHIISIAGGLALALLIGAGLLFVAALNG